jgi:hypothetical protein
MYKEEKKQKVYVHEPLRKKEIAGRIKYGWKCIE